RAEADGTLAILAIDRLALGQEICHDVTAAAELTGLSEDDVRHIWRSLGFPEPAEGEAAFSDEDVRNMRAVAELMEAGVVRPDIAFAMTRVLGSSMARVASAIVDAVSAQAEELEQSEVALDPAIRAGGFLPMFPDILEQVWRRHLQAAARRRLLRGDPEEGEGLVVGFADLVGFTALAQQASDEELAQVVDQFERLAYDVIIAGGGRVVKMIGDEVMFLVDDPVAAAEIALGIAEASRSSADLTDVRVGLAIGPVLEREGDAYGATVNLASRSTAIAYPGSVVVSPELRAVLAEHPDYAFRNLRPRSLKNIGRVSLSVLRRADDRPSSLRGAIDGRRRQVREVIVERLATIGVELPGAAEGSAPADEPSSGR
ncbi:MAG TPA: adenylate/guanylate cyclase domain-containing protein, partial [Acidimicrobiales bacterium]|nr:adenylate/guanylate cyclase domain-containing protein [Acidimicrobiales bacterium]